MDQALIFFFIDTPTTEISPLSLHAALPISRGPGRAPRSPPAASSTTSSSSPAHERAGELAGVRLLRPGARRFRPTPALPCLPRPARAPPPRTPDDARRAASAARLPLGRAPRPARLRSVALSRAGPTGGRRLARELPRGQHAA